MRQSTGRLLEIELDGETISGRIACPDELRPAPGQYLLASPLDDAWAALAVPLFASGFPSGKDFKGSPIPRSWAPGAQLSLRGPIGRGFRLPPNARRVCLASFGGGPARLFPLAAQALDKHAAVNLCVDLQPLDSTLRDLPAAVEITPLDGLRDAAAWADYLAIEAPGNHLASLFAGTGFEKSRPLACEAQALVWGPMPCAALAECGACAVHTRRGWSLACKDGPVFDLADLLL